MWPFDKFKRRDTKKRRIRAFAAADFGRLTSSWKHAITSIDRDLQTQLTVLRGRSRELCANNEYAKRFLHQCKVNIVGAHGIALQNHARDANGTLDRAANTAIETAWRDWSKRGHCEVTGKLSRADIERLIIESVARDGEVLIRKVPGYDNSSRYALQIIEADFLDERLNIERSNGTSIRMGVDLDVWGKPTAYHLLRKHPGDMRSIQSREHIVVSAEDILHIFIPLRPHQTRGIPWMHASMISLFDLGGYREAAIVAARVGAAKMGFFTSPTGEEYQGDAVDGAGNLITEAQPGTFDQLAEGTTLESWDPTYPHDQFESFNKALLRGISGGLGVAYHTFANDLEGVNFSSARAGILEERDTWTMLQEWLIQSFDNLVYPEWLKYSLMTGRIIMPNGTALPSTKFDKFNAGTFQGRRWSWVDPLKDIQANRESIAQRIRSISSVIRETGNDPDDVFEEIAQEREKLAAMGITPEELTGSSAADSEEVDNAEKPEKV